MVARWSQEPPRARRPGQRPYFSVLTVRAPKGGFRVFPEPDCDSIVEMAVQRKKTIRGRAVWAARKAREYAMVARALASTAHPVLAQIVPARFCNLSCAYCNEYDKVSEPVPLDEMLRRIDHLARLGTSIITISGGEPFTHPGLDEIIRRIRNRRRLAGIITNGYLLTPERIERLNR